MSVSNNKTSILIPTQVPQFVRDDHENFVLFLEEYYKFLEQEDQTLNISKNLASYKNVDLSQGIFLEKLYDNFISLIPQKVLADRTLILKHIKDFYRSRGSEKSIRFIMRILFNKEIDFYYPKKDILKASDGKWYVQKSVRIGDILVNNVANTIAKSNFVNKRITGLTSNATAIVESIDSYYDKGELVTELKLSNEYRTFIDGETIYCNYEENGNVKYLSGILFSGVVVSVSLANGGSGYIEGASVPVEGGGGTGAQVIVGSTTKGSISSIGVSYGGAGFKVSDNILITGGGGVDATANVLSVDLSEKYHPNSYSMVGSTIALEANTPINNVRYSNLNSSIVNPINHWIQNSMSYWTYSNCGPVATCLVTNVGDHYTSNPALNVLSNTAVRSLGILGRMEIIRGGTGYVIGDRLNFNNPIGCYGVGATANVTNVAANGAITEVKWQTMNGHLPGGSGYDSVIFPTVSVSSVSGTNANVVVTSIIGDNEDLKASAITYGQILELKIISGGSGYTTAPTLNLANMSSGSGAQASAFVVSGAYTYPGRFLNDDGFISAHNFIQDRDYYQNYSYVIRIDESTSKYRQAIKELAHPAGMKMFGHYTFTDKDGVNPSFEMDQKSANTILKLLPFSVRTDDSVYTGTYTATTRTATYTPRTINATYNVDIGVAGSFTTFKDTITISSNNHGFKPKSEVYLSFNTTQFPNLVNGLYTVASSNTDYIIVPVANGNTSLFTPTTNVTSNLTLSTGIGTTNSWITLSQYYSNSNVSIVVGDKIYVDSNASTVVYTGQNMIAVSPAYAGNLSNKIFTVVKAPYYPTGNVVLNSPIITLRANSTDLITNDNVYITFQSSDSTLVNTRYQVLFANSNMVKVAHRNIQNSVSKNGSAQLAFNTVTVQSDYHNLANNEQIYINFTSGDTGNAVNTLYSVTGVTQNSFNVVTTYPVKAGGNLFYKTSNLTMTVANHGLTSNTNTYIWFRSGDTANLSNSFYTVFVKDSSNFMVDVTNVPSSNGNISLYRNFCNVTITGTVAANVGDDLNFLLENGDTANVSNGVFRVITKNASNVIVKHTNIRVGSLENLLAANTGNAYVSLHK